ncbi:MAG: hypothetical protein J6B12_02160, partial [Clostridia bacterium]|nr:hypothetical protein [Clostridia bacterium]
YEGSKSDYLFSDNSYLVIMIAFALAILAIFFICWLLSKKQKRGWLIAALVLFSIDTVGMLYFYGLYLDVLIDLAFHVWVIVAMILGVVAAGKLKEMPPEEQDEDEKEGVDYFPETIELRNGKTLEKVSANYFFGKYTFWRKYYEGGYLYFYNDRVIFETSDYSSVYIKKTLRYADMIDTKPNGANGLYVCMTDGAELLFIIKARGEIMKMMDQKILTAKRQRAEAEALAEAEAEALAKAEAEALAKAEAVPETPEQTDTSTQAEA